MKRFTMMLIAMIAIACTTNANAEDAKKKKKIDKNGSPITALFEKLDANKDGKIDAKEFAEFKGLANAKADAPKSAKKVEGVRDQLFKKLDTNSDNYLSKEEFAKITDVAKELKGKAKKKEVQVSTKEKGKKKIAKAKKKAKKAAKALKKAKKNKKK